MKEAYNRLLTHHAVANGTHSLAGDVGRRCSAHPYDDGGWAGFKTNDCNEL